MGWMSETNGIVRDGVLKSLHCVENNDRELICRIRRVFHHECISFESIVFIVMTMYELCSDHSDYE